MPPGFSVLLTTYTFDLRRLVDAQHPVVVEVLLACTRPSCDVDLAEHRAESPNMMRAFDLRYHRAGVHLLAAIDAHIDAMHFDLAVPAPRSRRPAPCSVP